MTKTILVIDDDEKLNSLLKDYLSEFSFKVITETNPERALNLLKRKTPDIIILDIMLPGMDGFEVCRRIRKSYSIPVVMLTARGKVEDRIVGLELGADDYLPKPFEPRELVARIQSVLRRSLEIGKTRRFLFKSLVVDIDKQLVLHHLIKNTGKVLDRDQIMDSLRGLEWEAFDRSVDVLISRLRQKLRDDPKSPRFIRTIWGRGYKFIGEGSGE